MHGREGPAPFPAVPDRCAQNRMCTNYRTLNRITIKNKYPLPRISELLDRLRGAKYFTKIDLRSGFHQIRIRKEDTHKTAFRSRFGHYEFLAMPFRLTNAPATFQSTMNHIFRNPPKSVSSSTFMTSLSSAPPSSPTFNTSAKSSRSSERKNSTPSSANVRLALRASNTSATLSPLEALVEYPPPKTLLQLRSVLDLANYYRSFIHNFSEISYPLHELTRKGEPFHWNDRCQHTFDLLKQTITSAPVLKIADPTRHFYVTTDASDFAIGAVLSQHFPCDTVETPSTKDSPTHPEAPPGDYPIAFASKKLLPSEIDYPCNKKELLAVIQALTVWRPYLDGQYFTTLLAITASSRTSSVTVILAFSHNSGNTSSRPTEPCSMYFAPHARKPVTFDILDTDFDIILGMPWLASADHTVNFHWRTLTVRDTFAAEVPCTIPLPHPSIRRQVVTAKSFRATCAYEQPDEIGLCFLRTVVVTDSSPTDLSSDPRVVRLLDEFTDILESPTGVVLDRPISHEIILEAGAVPPKGYIYRMSEEELTVLLAQLDDLLDKGWIRPSSSSYGAPVLFVWKKNKDLRLCIDYRKLNAQTVKNVKPLPRIDDLLERLGGAKYFSKLDLKSGYHQISIRRNDRYKSAFKTRYGHFEWVVMPFGLTNAPTTFQATMTNRFRATLDWFVLVYLDDILVYSRSLEDHLEHLRWVLGTLRHAKYKANRDKCEFVRQELEYLGRFVTPEGISPLSDKIQAIQEWSEPRNVTDVRSFLGLAGYYQRFIKGYSKIAAHLSKLQCEDRMFDLRGNRFWLSKPLYHLRRSCESTTHYCRRASLRMRPAMAFVSSSSNTMAWTGTRSSTSARKCPSCIPFTMHARRSSEVPVVHSIYDARKKELLAFVHALKRWRHFLLGRSQFRWVTDNNPLVFYKTQDTVNSTIARWMAFIDQFDFFSDHIPEKSNRFADALSRRLDHCTTVYSTFEIGDDLRDSFIRGYQADPEFHNKYANCSSPNPTLSHYRIQEWYLLVHTRGKDLCVPSDSHLRTRLLGEFHDAPATRHFGVNRTIGRLRE
ncbi:hypothetical protein CBR_g31092 [Chara braunii]|uniref:RNA-directed DNA polymerase n=1 Tax=Chara braunii TaxID=69332 RepID=A0A388LEJ4_CHABU|nr:hypothetical protein CBR_g31092 [Chara braunii]|eukprot:GBG80632.1 hypothetical protein CBR_g31092 [Chara braunii]